MRYFYVTDEQLAGNNNKAYSIFRWDSIIHSKSEKNLRILLFSLKKSAEKVRKSQQQNFEIKVRKSIISLKMYDLKANL